MKGYRQHGLRVGYNLNQEWFSWKGVEHLSSIYLLKGNILYIAISAVLVRAQDVLEKQGWIFDLPFNWETMFWSALFYIVGYGFYFLLCPVFVKLYPDYQALSKSSFVNEDFKQEFISMKKKNVNPRHNFLRIDELIDVHNSSYFKETYCNDAISKTRLTNDKIYESLVGMNRGSDISEIESYFKIVYSFVFNAWSKSNKIFSIVALLIYGVSFYMLVKVIWQNLYSVLSYLL